MTRANKLIDVFQHIDMTGGPDACWLWKLELNTNGRPYFTVRGKKYIAYRLVYELTYGVELGDRMFLHQCDTPNCCNPRHGKPGDNAANMKEMKERERHGLPHHTVRGIKKLLQAGRPHQEIAELYGISRVAVTEINSGRNYSHVKEEEETNGNDA